MDENRKSGSQKKGNVSVHLNELPGNQDKKGNHTPDS